MQSVKEKITFYLSALLYLVFNFRMGVDAAASMKATLWQILQTAPYVAGVTYVIIALLQYMSGGERWPGIVGCACSSPSGSWPAWFTPSMNTPASAPCPENR